MRRGYNVTVLFCRKTFLPEDFGMSPENEQFLRQLVEYKRFPSYEAALDAAVRYYREEYTKAVEELREKVREGLDSLERDGGRPLDIEKMKAELRRQHESREAARAAS